MSKLGRRWASKVVERLTSARACRRGGLTVAIACALQLLSAAPANPQTALAKSETATDPELFSPDGVSIGSPQAPITVIEYLSTTCSHCAAFDAATYPHVEHDFLSTGRVRLIVRELPTAPVIVSSASFLLARCNGRGGYWGAIRKLFAAQNYVLNATDLASAVKRAAEVIGLPQTSVAKCLGDEAAISDLNQRRQAALDSGIDSTPTFLFNGRRLQPGELLGRVIYEGGELSPTQFDDAIRSAIKRLAPQTKQRPTQ